MCEPDVERRAGVTHERLAEIFTDAIDSLREDIAAAHVATRDELLSRIDANLARTTHEISAVLKLAQHVERATGTLPGQVEALDRRIGRLEADTATVRERLDLAAGVLKLGQPR